MPKAPDVNDATIMEYVKDARVLRDEQDQFENAAADKGKAAAIIEDCIRDWMVEHSLSSMVVDGMPVRLKPEVRGKIQDALAFFNYLVATGNADLGSLKLPPRLGFVFKEWAEKEKIDIGGIDVAIAWNTLAKFLSDACDVTDSKTWPPGVDVEAWDKVVIKPAPKKN